MQEFTLVGVFVGFILALVWDLWKENRRKKDEYRRLLYSLSNEVDSNIDLIERRGFLELDSEILREFVQREFGIKLLPNQMIPIRVTPPLSESVWNTIATMGYLRFMKDELRIKLSEVYGFIRARNGLTGQLVSALKMTLTLTIDDKEKKFDIPFRTLISIYDEIIRDKLKNIKRMISDEIKAS